MITPESIGYQLHLERMNQINKRTPRSVVPLTFPQFCLIYDRIHDEWYFT